jgi:glycosyltransferase involved in cell wall biosynthesis
MKVLVIIFTWDREEYWREALDSVLKQTRPADEIVITGNVGHESPYFREATDRTIERINAIIEKSDCDAFVMLCDDDRLQPIYLERTLKLMEEQRTDIVYTGFKSFGQSDVQAIPGEWTKDNIDGNTVPYITTLCSKEAWKRAGGFEHPFFPQFYPDWFFWWKCFYTGATATRVPEPLFDYRVHATQATTWQNTDESRQNTLQKCEEWRTKHA